jgi:hypothetical protein
VIGKAAHATAADARSIFLKAIDFPPWWLALFELGTRFPANLLGGRRNSFALELLSPVKARMTKKVWLVQADHGNLPAGFRRKHAGTRRTKRHRRAQNS